MATPTRGIRLRAVVPAPQVLREALVEALGSDLMATAVLAEALSESGRAALPALAADIIAFAWAHLAIPVSRAVGPRAATEFVHRLQRALEAQASRSLRRFDRVSAPPPPHPAQEAPAPRPEDDDGPPSHVRTLGQDLRVLLVDVEALRRSTLSRALVQLGVSVMVADTLDDTLTRLAELSPLDVLVCWLEQPEQGLALSSLLDKVAVRAVVAFASHAAETRMTLGGLGVDRFVVLEPTCGASSTVATIVEVATAARVARSG